MVAIVAPGEVQAVLDGLSGSGEQAWVIGEIAPGDHEVSLG